jgi:hypothetical protein
MNVTLGNYRYPSFRTDQGSFVSVDHQRMVATPSGMGTTTVCAQNGWINVWPSAPSAQKIRVALTDKEYQGSNATTPARETTTIVDLQGVDGGTKFTAPLPPLPISSGGPHAMPTRHVWQLALVKDGIWEKDATTSQDAELAPDPTYIP